MTICSYKKMNTEKNNNFMFQEVNRCGGILVEIRPIFCENSR